MVDNIRYLFLPSGPAKTLQLDTRSVRIVTGPLVSTVTTTIDSSIKVFVVGLMVQYLLILGTLSGECSATL